MKRLKLKQISILSISLLLLLMAGTAGAASTFFDTSATTAYPASANDILTKYAVSAFDVAGSNTFAWANGGLKVFDTATRALVHDIGTPDPNYSAWVSFVRADPNGGVWVGFTTGNNTDDRIYFMGEPGMWKHKATLACNFDMEFNGGNAYVSGLNSTNWGDPNAIWLLDQTGNNNHDKIVEMSGNSAGLAFDADGNAYYASYDNLLYRWDAADIAGAVGDGNLTYADGTKLADLELGAYDVTVDDAGNVIFNGNGGYAYTALWNGTAGDGANYDYIGIGDGSYGDWFSFIDAEGDVTAGGTLYQTDAYYMGIAEVNAVPIPAAAWLLGSGLLGLMGFRRRR